MFINDAYAAAQPAMQSGSLGATLVQLALIMLIFYFLLVRPQQKKIKEHNELVDNLKIGDRVITNGGLYGKVAKTNGMEITLEVAENVKVVVDRMAVATLAIAEDPKEKAAEEKKKKAPSKAAKSTTKEKTSKKAKKSK